MAKIPSLDAIRIIPRDTDFLDRKSGLRGEIFYDRTDNSLRLYDGFITGGVNLAKSDLTNVNDTLFRKKSVESRVSTVVYTVTVTGPQGGDTGNKYNLNSVYRPVPNFVVGYTYVFIQDDQTNVFFPNANGSTPNPHPLNFSADNLSGLLGGGTSYLTNVRYFLDGASVTQTVYNSAAFNTATSRQVWITVTNSTPATLYYWCYNHVAMGNEIAVADPGSGTGIGGITSVDAGPGISIAITEGLVTVTNVGVLDIESGSGITVADTDGIFTIANTGVLDLVAGTGISLTSNQGVFTINSSAAAGDLIFSTNTVDLATGSQIVFVPDVNFSADVILGGSITFPDNTVQTTATVQGPQGPEGPPGPSGSGAGDVVSVLDGYTDNAIVRYSGTSGNNIKTSAASINDSGVVSAAGFSGSGSSLTALNATQLTSGTVPNARFPATLPAASGVNLTALNATQLTSGTVPDARFPATLPAVSGTNLTNLNATNLASGTVPVNRLGTAGTRDATTFLRGDNTWATVSGGGTASDSFATISVAGQSNVVADSATDTLTLVAGTGITITTDAGADSITITNSAAAANAFATVAVSGQSNVVADSTADTLIIAAGTGISITTDAGTDTVTITSTVVSGATSFTQLSDSANATVDQIYLPAITMLTVTNNGASSYRFDQYGTADNPTVYAINGTTIAFNLNVSGHPFLIQNGAGVNYDVGLVHVSTGGTVTTGSSAQGKTSGTLYWKIPTAISGGYRYQCSIHAPMVGSISIKTFSTI
jgi:plastocyanin